GRLARHRRRLALQAAQEQAHARLDAHLLQELLLHLHLQRQGEAEDVAQGAQGQRAVQELPQLLRRRRVRREERPHPGAQVAPQLRLPRRRRRLVGGQPPPRQPVHVGRLSLLSDAGPPPTPGGEGLPPVPPAIL